MTERLGLEMRLYRNTGDFATPAYSEVTNVKDLTSDFEKALADLTTRRAKGWRQSRGTLKNGSTSFQMLYDPDDTEYVFFETNYFANPGDAAFTTFEVFLADGDITVSGTRYIRMRIDITNFSRSENLEEGVMIDVTITSAVSADGEHPQPGVIP